MGVTSHPFGSSSAMREGLARGSVQWRGGAGHVGTWGGEKEKPGWGGGVHQHHHWEG